MAIVTSLDPRLRARLAVCASQVWRRGTAASVEQNCHKYLQACFGARSAMHMQAKNCREIRGSQQGWRRCIVQHRWQNLSAGLLRASCDFCVSSGRYSGHILNYPKNEETSAAGQGAFRAPADGASLEALLFTHAGLSGPATARLTVTGCRLAAGSKTSISRLAAC